MDYQLDLRDYRCPLPVVMTQRAMATLASGDRLWVVLNADTQPADLVALCERHSWAIQQMTAEQWRITKGLPD